MKAMNTDWKRISKSSYSGVRDRFLEAGKRCVFLVGVPRSGTNWIQSMLSAHPDVGSSQESHLFNHYISPMLRQWERNLAFEDGRGGIGLPAYFTEQSFLSSLNAMAFDTLSQSEDFNRHSVFVENTPDHLVCLRDISRVIPSARFVYLEREPAEVIESLMAAGRTWGHAWAPRNVFRATRLYFNYRNEALRQLESLRKNSYTVMDYRRMKLHPKDTLARILRFLNLTACDEELAHMTSSKSDMRRYGEFARLNGPIVDEPKDFVRGKKMRLPFWQKRWIAYCKARSPKLRQQSSVVIL